jgi:hypothetical protein
MSRIPVSLDPFLPRALNQCWDGELGGDELPRLRAAALEGAPISVRIGLSIVRGALGETRLQGTITGEIGQQCQRCLQPMTWRFSLEPDVVLVDPAGPRRRWETIRSSRAGTGRSAARRVRRGGDPSGIAPGAEARGLSSTSDARVRGGGRRSGCRETRSPFCRNCERSADAHARNLIHCARILEFRILEKHHGRSTSPYDPFEARHAPFP